MSKYSTATNSRSKINKRSLAATALVCAIMFVFLGCDRETRHDIITFFFEGVPPLGGDPNAILVTQASDDGLAGSDAMIVEVPKTPAQLAFISQKHSSKHKFLKKCSECHAGGLGSGRRELRKPMPDMCFSCHKDFIRYASYVHGPLNVGECVFCHDPHQSKFVHLQKAAQPDLCYRCHRKQEIKKIKDHEPVLELICTDCHDPHVSSLPMLMKANPITNNPTSDNDPNEAAPELVIEKETEQ